jgi:hypothetical protein
MPCFDRAGRNVVLEAFGILELCHLLCILLKRAQWLYSLDVFDEEFELRLPWHITMGDTVLRTGDVESSLFSCGW